MSGRKSSFDAKQAGHADLNTSEQVASAETWRRLHEAKGKPAEAGDFRSKLAPWASVRPRAAEKNLADAATPAPAPAASSPTPNALNEEPPVSGEAFLAKCLNRAITENFTNFHGTWQRLFNGLLNDTLTCRDLKEAAKTSPSFAQDFPLILGDILLQQAVDANQPLADGWRTKHDFMLARARNGGYTLNAILAKRLEGFARHCVVDFHETPFGNSTDAEPKTTTHRANLHSLPPCKLDTPDARKEFLDLCHQYALHAQLPDSEENPARTNAFRAALRHAIDQVTGLSAIDLTNRIHLESVSGKLKREVRTNVFYHLRRFPNTNLDYVSVLHSNNDLATDVSRCVDHFTRFCAREFIQQQSTISRGNATSR